jgi:hypothetical protein
VLTVLQEFPRSIQNENNFQVYVKKQLADGAKVAILLDSTRSSGMTN